MQLDPTYDVQVRQVAGDDAAALVADGVRVLDVRTPQEFSDLGHIPGAMLLPVQIIASAPAVLGDPDTPVLVTCEHAVRSKVATRLLVQAGFTRVYELAHGMALWDGPRAHEAQPMAGPSPWLIECSDLVPRSGTRARRGVRTRPARVADCLDRPSGDGARSRRGRTRAPSGDC